MNTVQGLRIDIAKAELKIEKIINSMIKKYGFLQINISVEQNFIINDKLKQVPLNAKVKLEATI